MVRGQRADVESCDARRIRSLDLTRYHPEMSASETNDGRHLYIVTPEKRIMVWTADLDPLVTLSAPKGREFSVLIDLCVDESGHAIYAVLDEAREIWRYDLRMKRWGKVATLPFSIRSIGLSSARSLIAGSSDDGRVVGFDLASGKQIFSGNVPGAAFVSIDPVSHGGSIFVSALAPRHSIFRMNARTGALESGNINRFSGPANILAISPDGRQLILEGVGMPQGRSSKSSGMKSGLTLELWDAERLLPIGEGLRTGVYEYEVVAFSPTSERVAFTISSNPRIAILPLGLQDWIAAACRKAGRTFADIEANRFSIGVKPCSPPQVGIKPRL